MPKDRPPTIIALIAIAVAVFAYELVSDRLVSGYATVPVELHRTLLALKGGEFDGQSLRVFLKLVTGMCLHADASHLIYNMVFLWAFGSLCSKHLGKWTVLVLFLTCGAIGNVAQCWLNLESPASIIGASGGIMALEGVYLAIAVRWTLPNPDVWPLAYPIPPRQMAAFGVVGFGFDLYSLMDHSVSRVAFGAHIGGFASGFLIAWLITQISPTEDFYIKAGRRR